MRISKGKADPERSSASPSTRRRTPSTGSTSSAFPSTRRRRPSSTGTSRTRGRGRTGASREGGRSWRRSGLSGRDTSPPAGSSRCSAHELIDLVREGGVVAGAIARGPGGEAEVRGRATVLTTGGYAAGPELFAEVTPGAPRLVTAAWRDVERGRHPDRVRGGGVLPRCGALPADTRRRSSASPGRVHDWPEFVNLTAADRPPRELHVNARGERFLAEDDRSPDRRERALLEQPGHRFWIVFDEDALAGEPLGYVWDAETVRARLGVRADDVGELARLSRHRPRRPRPHSCRVERDRRRSRPATRSAARRASTPSRARRSTRSKRARPR